jgi:hypothetical protein
MHEVNTLLAELSRQAVDEAAGQSGAAQAVLDDKIQADDGAALERALTTPYRGAALATAISKGLKEMQSQGLYTTPKNGSRHKSTSNRTARTGSGTGSPEDYVSTFAREGEVGHGISLEDLGLDPVKPAVHSEILKRRTAAIKRSAGDLFMGRDWCALTGRRIHSWNRNFERLRCTGPGPGVKEHFPGISGRIAGRKLLAIEWMRLAMCSTGKSRSGVSIRENQSARSSKTTSRSYVSPWRRPTRSSLSTNQLPAGIELPEPSISMANFTAWPRTCVDRLLSESAIEFILGHTNHV